MATWILRMNGDTKELGNKWVHKFTQANPSIASVVGKPKSSDRVNATHPTAIQDIYTMLHGFIREFNIQPSNMWNMDEHGLGLGICTNTTIIAS